MLMPVDHYENFPVASWLLPAKLRPPVQAIYHWARFADDLADEGNVAASERLAALEEMRNDLMLMEAGRAPVSAIATVLAPHIHAFELPFTPFHDLLSAFTQDVTVGQYESFADLRAYCSKSADPVGRLMLHLYGAATPRNLEWSDAICTGLQLANFWQDVAIDQAKQRTYMPLETLAMSGSRIAHIQALCAGAPVDAPWRNALGFEIDRARKLLMQGSPLARALPGRIGLELRFVVAGGLRILDLIEIADYDVFRRRPSISRKDAWAILRTVVQIPLVQK
jgi:phytoene synthase